MTRWALAGCMALAAVGAAAVLDVGAATAVAEPSASPFAGSWSGTWSVAEAGQDGTLDLTISDAGVLSGRVYHAQDGESGWGTVVGDVRADGRLNLIAFAPADNTTSHASGVPHQGTVVIDGEGKLVAVFTGTSNGFTVAAVLERK